MRSSFLRLAFLTLFIAGLLASGCGTKRIISQWSNPAYRSFALSFKRILVVGATDQTSIRRNFEDELVAALKQAASPRCQAIVAGAIGLSIVASLFARPKTRPV